MSHRSRVIMLFCLHDFGFIFKKSLLKRRKMTYKKQQHHKNVSITTIWLSADKILFYNIAVVCRHQHFNFLMSRA